MKKACVLIIALLIMLSHAASAEVVRFGKTECLLQPAEGQDCLKRYIFFVGSGDYFSATRKCVDLTATDGMLLIPEGNAEYVLNSRASDRVMEDIRPQLLEWAEAGYKMILIGYSSGGYPAVELARELAEAGYPGQLFILDGANRAYKGIYYNADFYRKYLTEWTVTICASEKDTIRIAGNTRALGEELREDGNVTYLVYKKSHNEMKNLALDILSGSGLPDPVSRQNDGKGGNP